MSKFAMVAQAPTMARMGFDQLLVSGGARGVEAFVKESVSQLADLAWDVASAPASAQSRQDLLDRADALATLLGNPGLAVDHFSNADAQADALEQQGRLNDAEQIRAQATLDLLSMVAGGTGVAKAAITSLPKVAELGKIVAAGTRGTAVDSVLLDQLASNGVKFTRENVIATGTSPDGKVVFLETGNPTAGLQHIITEHAADFANIGISAEKIPDVIMQAVTQGKVVGYQGAGTGRPIYEIIINGENRKIAITIGSNGYIVGANPRSM